MISQIEEQNNQIEESYSDKMIYLRNWRKKLLKDLNKKDYRGKN